MPKPNAIHGIALGGLFALDPNAVRILDPDEAARAAVAIANGK